MQSTWGVDISSGLSWNTHIDRITGTATRTLNFIQRNIRTKNKKVRETAYNTLVRPQLEYASPVWDPHHKEKYSSWKKYNAGQLAGPPVVLTIGQV